MVTRWGDNPYKIGTSGLRQKADRIAREIANRHKDLVDLLPEDVKKPNARYLLMIGGSDLYSASSEASLKQDILQLDQFLDF